MNTAFICFVSFIAGAMVDCLIQIHHERQAEKRWLELLKQSENLKN